MKSVQRFGILALLGIILLFVLKFVGIEFANEENKVIDSNSPMFQFEISENLYPNEHAYILSEAQSAINYVEKQLGLTINKPVKINFGESLECGVGATTNFDWRNIRVDSCNSISKDRAVHIMAYAFARMVLFDNLVRNEFLSQGLAVWACGEYWLSGESDFRSFVKHNYNRDALLPLDAWHSNVDEQNMLYYERAAFVEYLLSPKMGYSVTDVVNLMNLSDIPFVEQDWMDSIYSQ